MHIRHCGTKEIVTERLRLRPFLAEDAADVFAGWTGDPRVAKYTSWYAHTSAEETKGYIAYILSMDPGTSYNWIAEKDGKPVGTVNVCWADDRLGVAGLAYAFSYDSWGKGYATEAARAAAKLLFEIGYRKLIAGCDAANTGSARVLEKIGMKREGCFRQAILRKDGSWGDDLQYGLFREELI